MVCIPRKIVASTAVVESNSSQKFLGNDLHSYNMFMHYIIFSNIRSLQAKVYHVHCVLLFLLCKENYDFLQKLFLVWCPIFSHRIKMHLHMLSLDFNLITRLNMFDQSKMTQYIKYHFKSNCQYLILHKFSKILGHFILPNRLSIAAI